VVGGGSAHTGLCLKSNQLIVNKTELVVKLIKVTWCEWFVPERSNNSSIWFIGSAANDREVIP